jgi:gas vesicle protein
VNEFLKKTQKNFKIIDKSMRQISIMSTETDTIIDIVIDIIGNREVEGEAEKSVNNTQYSKTGSYLGGFVNPVIGSVVGGVIGSLVDQYFAKGTSKYVREILDEMPEKSRNSLAEKIMALIDELGFKTISGFESFYKRNCENKQNEILRKFSEKSLELINIEVERYQNPKISIIKSREEDRTIEEKYKNVTDQSKT